MMKISPPAFPTYLADNMTHGMSLRDYFAAAAMSSLLLTPWYADEEKTYNEMAPHLADDAYIIADAMMKAREE
jgi:hypothetical protein